MFIPSKRHFQIVTLPEDQRAKAIQEKWPVYSFWYYDALDFFYPHALQLQPEDADIINSFFLRGVAPGDVWILYTEYLRKKASC